LDPLTIAAGVKVTSEVINFALSLVELAKAKGELTDEQKARCEALNSKTERDYVIAAGGKE
jgi:hypothetical protein